MDLSSDALMGPLARSFECEDIGETVDAMRKQERTTYLRRDFLSSQQTGEEGKVVDANWRLLMCKWMHDMADVWHISRDMACFGAYYLDMILAKGDGGIVQSLQDLQLVTMTCLHLAIKLHSFTLVSHRSVVKYGRGQFTVDDMAAMEQRILEALNWQLHPPTSRCFQRQFMRLFPRDDVNESISVLVSEVSRFFIELATNNYSFCKYSGASVAYAAMIIAIEGTSRKDLPMSQRAQFYCRMRTVIGISHTSKELFEVYSLMKHTFKEAGDIKGLVKGNTLWKSHNESLGLKLDGSSHHNSPRGIEDVLGDRSSGHNPAA